VLARTNRNDVGAAASFTIWNADLGEVRPEFAIKKSFRIEHELIAFEFTALNALVFDYSAATFNVLETKIICATFDLLRGKGSSL